MASPLLFITAAHQRKDHVSSLGSFTSAETVSAPNGYMLRQLGSDSSTESRPSPQDHQLLAYLHIHKLFDPKTRDPDSETMTSMSLNKRFMFVNIILNMIGIEV